MKVINEIADECFRTVAKHHADRLREDPSGFTEDQIRQAVSKNWKMISEEVADLYSMVVVLLEDTEVQF